MPGGKGEIREYPTYVQLVGFSGKDVLNILSGYAASETDASNGGYSYFGFESVDGNWYIMKKTLGILSSIRYLKGDSDLATTWASRTTETYDTFTNTFG